VVHSGERSYFQVVPRGFSARTNGIWAIITPTIPAGISMYAPPLPGADRAFNGTFGAALGPTLAANTDVFFMSPGDAGVSYWTTLRWNGNAWVHVSGPYDFLLDPGQGFFVSTTAPATPRHTGPVGNTGSQTNHLIVGYNIIGISEGKLLPASTAFNSFTPVASYDSTLSDQVVILNANGSWRRLLRHPTSPSHIWYDTQNMGPTTLQLEPGRAYYYIRRGTEADLTF